MRDHLFISYATEDAAFVRWLALKLSARGYRVWWDQEKLHGGDAFPSAIDSAIKTRTFRMLAVLSLHSSHKPNPEAERTLGLALGKERNEPFLIPLNLELSTSELPWMMANLSYVSFTADWALGLRQLLDALQHAGAPCYPAEAESLVRTNLSEPDFIANAVENVWLNLFEVNNVPLGVSRYEWTQDVRDEDLVSWVHHREGPRACWAAEPPPTLKGRAPARDQYALSTRPNGVNLNHLMTSLLRQYVELRCRQRGLAPSPDGSVFYFRASLAVASRLPFTLPTGRETWLRPVGERRVWQQRQPEQVRYHLAFSFRVELNRVGSPVLQIRPTVHFTTLGGEEIDSARNVRRARAVRNSWFNDKWLARVAAIGSYLAEGASSWMLSPALKISVSGTPLRLSSSPSLDEAARSAWLAMDDHDESEEGDLHLGDEEGFGGDD